MPLLLSRYFNEVANRREASQLILLACCTSGHPLLHPSPFTTPHPAPLTSHLSINRSAAQRQGAGWAGL